MQLVNLTPHTVNLGTLVIPASGKVARVAEVKSVAHTFDDLGFSLVTVQNGPIENLPESSDDKLFIVSAQVRVAAPHRKDLASPGDLVRDDQGRVIGCNSLIVNQV